MFYLRWPRLIILFTLAEVDLHARGLQRSQDPHREEPRDHRVDRVSCACKTTKHTYTTIHSITLHHTYIYEGSPASCLFCPSVTVCQKLSGHGLRSHIGTPCIAKSSSPSAHLSFCCDHKALFLMMVGTPRDILPPLDPTFWVNEKSCGWSMLSTVSPKSPCASLLRRFLAAKP